VSLRFNTHSLEHGVSLPGQESSKAQVLAHVVKWLPLLPQVVGNIAKERSASIRGFYKLRRYIPRIMRCSNFLMCPNLYTRSSNVSDTKIGLSNRIFILPSLRYACYIALSQTRLHLGKHQVVCRWQPCLKKLCRIGAVLGAGRSSKVVFENLRQAHNICFLQGSSLRGRADIEQRMAPQYLQNQRDK